MKFIFFQNLQFLVGHELLIDIKGLVGFFTARYIFMLTNSYLLRLSATWLTQYHLQPETSPGLLTAYIF